jgi:hypothetical protein
VAGIHLLELSSRLLNLLELRLELPDEFSDVYDAEQYARSQAHPPTLQRIKALASTPSR